MLILNFLPNRRRIKPQTTTLQRRLVLEIKSLELRRTAISDFLELEAEAVRINEEVKMADSFQLKAIITAVDQLTGPMKGMQRELKGFQKEMGSLALGAVAAEPPFSVRWRCPLMLRSVLSQKWLTSGRWLTASMIKAFAQMSDDILTLSTQLPMAAEGIAEIVAAGGQAGIARDLMQFANDAVKMGVAFDTTAEESPAR
jgi:hypothetical protein